MGRRSANRERITQRQNSNSPESLDARIARLQLDVPLGFYCFLSLPKQMPDISAPDPRTKFVLPCFYVPVYPAFNVVEDRPAANHRLAMTVGSDLALFGLREFVKETIEWEYVWSPSEFRCLDILQGIHLGSVGLSIQSHNEVLLALRQAQFLKYAT